MLKRKLFFADSKQECYRHLHCNSKISQLPRLPRHIFDVNKPKLLINKNESKIYSFIFKQINFELLSVFYTVVVLGSVSKAAKKLSLTQPAISFALRKIENQIGSLLFKNLTSKKIIVLTPHGLVLFTHLQRLFNIIEESLEFSNSNLSSIKSNTVALINLKSHSISFDNTLTRNLSFLSSKKILISNYLSKNYFINFNKLNFEFFENESEFIITGGKLVNFQTSYITKSIYNKFFLFKKFYPLKESNLSLFSCLGDINVIEIQTKKALTVCLDMKLTNFIFWGSEI